MNLLLTQPQVNAILPLRLKKSVKGLTMDSTTTMKFREERNRLLKEALLNQPPVSQEEAYAQYDRKMGVTSQESPTTMQEKQQSQVLQFISYFTNLSRKRPKLSISVVVIFIAASGLGFYLWNDVKAGGYWEAKTGSTSWQLILIENKQGNINGTGSLLGNNPGSFKITGFRTNRFVSLIIHEDKDEVAIFQGRLNGRNELTGNIVLPGDGNNKGSSIRLFFNRE